MKQLAIGTIIGLTVGLSLGGWALSLSYAYTERANAILSKMGWEVLEASGKPQEQQRAVLEAQARLLALQIEVAEESLGRCRK